MKKMMLVCFLMLCNSVIYGSDTSNVSSSENHKRIIQGRLENYLAFMQKINQIADSIIVKNSLQEIIQYTSKLSKYSDSFLVLVEYANAILGQITILVHDKISSSTGQYQCSISVPIIRVPVIKETQLSKTNFVQLYVDGYKEFLETLQKK